MPYLGNTAGNRFVASKAATQFSGDGSTTAFTLDHAVGSDEDILVSVDGVIQEPSVAYAVSNGTTLTFTAAPSSNSGNNIFVYYLFRTVATVDHPSTSSLQATDGTFSSTLNVTGETTLATHLNMGDNDKIKLGASGDLEVYHDGSNSFVDDTGTGNLFLRGESQVIIGNMTGEQAAVFNDDGAVTLNHDNSAKLATTSSGIDVTGAITASSATFTTADNTAQLTLKSTDADSSLGPVLDLVRDSASPADGDGIGQIKFTADNDAGEATTYANTFTTLRDASDGAEDGQVIHYVIIGGTAKDHLRMGTTSAGGQAEFTVNEGAADIDFRVKSDSGNTEHNNALKVVASNGQIFSTAIYNWTTSASANIVVTSSAGHLARSTSALKYKKDVRDLEDIDIDKFRPIRYKSKSDIDDQTKDNFGFIADEVHDAGITELVTYDGDNVEGFQYERLTPVLVKTLQEQKKTIKALTDRITALEKS